MSRQQRRHQSRQPKAPFSWEKIGIAAVALFFAGALAFSYFFPAINARTYATGSSRVQKIIINRGITTLLGTDSFEFVYYGTYEAEGDEHGDDPHMHWAQYIVLDTGATQSFRTEPDSDPIDAAELQVDYISVRDIARQLQADLKSRAYKVRHPSPGDTSIKSLIVEQRTDDVHKGYILEFTADHKIDTLHTFEMLGEDDYMQNMYIGLVTGVPEFPAFEDDDEDNEDD